MKQNENNSHVFKAQISFQSVYEEYVSKICQSTIWSKLLRHLKLEPPDYPLHFLKLKE